LKAHFFRSIDDVLDLLIGRVGFEDQNHGSLSDI